MRSRARWGVALALLAAAPAVPLGLSFVGTSEPPDLGQAPPYTVPSASGTTRLGAGWDPARDAEGAAALLYVSQQCPYCRSELANWAALDGEVPVWIVASPGSDFDALDWVPHSLRGHVVFDADGAIADALGVRAVPATVWIDEGGVVRDQRLGASSPAVIRREFRALADPPTPEAPSSDPLPAIPVPGGRP